MTSTALSRLELLCDTIPTLLHQIEQPVFTQKTNPEKWSKKEILGHLIDSATNNHHRFVRAQFEINFKLTYDQNNWNSYNYYQQISATQLIDFWTVYNMQLVALLRNISPEQLQLCCYVGDQLSTLDFLIVDYVQHLEHHLHQIVSYR